MTCLLIYGATSFYPELTDKGRAPLDENLSKSEKFTDYHRIITGRETVDKDVVRNTYPVTKSTPKTGL